MSQITPLQALRALIIERLYADLHFAPHEFASVKDGEEIDDLWAAACAEHPVELQEIINDVRTSGAPTGLAVIPVSRHYESEACAVLTPFDQWVGFVCWSGGGKHGAPDEIEWMKGAYWVEAEVDQVLRLEHKFTAAAEMPEPYDREALGEFHQRLAAMNAFCAPVTTESMCGQDVFTWIHSESQKLIATMGEDAAAGVGPMTAFKKAFGNGPVSGVVAALFAQEFMATPAKNYIELVYQTPEMGDFTVTIQKHDHKTPGQRIAELEDERDALLVRLKDAVKTWEEGDDDDVSGGIDRARQLIAKLGGE